MRLLARISLALLFAGVAGSVAAQSETVALPSDVTTIEQFIAFRDATADSPEGGAATFVLAMLLWETDAELGHDAMVVALDASELRADAEGYRGYSLGNRASELTSRYLEPRPYIARSYLLGTSPAHGYELPAERRLEITRNAYSVIADDRVKVFIACSGADSPRPITLARNNRGVWKAYEYSSLFVGVRPPEEVADDPL